MSCSVPVSIGELCDKVTILQIKQQRIKEVEKQEKINQELKTIIPVLEIFSINDELMSKLKTINQTLWDIEDNIRKKEMLKEFDDEFILLARSVYITNDKRFEIKNNINKCYSSNINEVKSYI